MQIPTSNISGFERAELIKVLGMTISRTFSVAKHVDELLTSCAQSLFALRTLRKHVSAMWLIYTAGRYINVLSTVLLQYTVRAYVHKMLHCNISYLRVLIFLAISSVSPVSLSIIIITSCAGGRHNMP